MLQNVPQIERCLKYSITRDVRLIFALSSVDQAEKELSFNSPELNWHS